MRRAGQHAQVLDQLFDGLLGVALVGADHPGGSAFDPADDVLAGGGSAIPLHAALHVGDHSGPLVERDTGQRQPAIAHRAQQQLGRQGDRLTGAADAAGAVQRGALALHCRHPTDPVHGRRGQQEPQMDPPWPAPQRPRRPLLQSFEVAPHRLVGLDDLLAGLVEHQLGGIHHHIGVGQLAQLAQFLGGELGLRGSAPAHDGHLADGAGVEHPQHVLGHIGDAQLPGRLGQDTSHVDRDVAHSDHHRAARVQGERIHRSVGMPAVPGHELGGRETTGKILAGDGQPAVDGRPGRVDQRVIVPS